MTAESAARRSVLAISGSPSATSKTATSADHVLAILARHEIDVHHIRLSTLDPVALLRGPWDEPGIVDLATRLSSANGVIVATPIFKAAYSGLLKAGLDVLPQFGLAGKVVLPLGTGGSIAHLLALDYALRPVLQSMGARHIVQSQFFGEQDFGADGAVTPSPATEASLTHAIRNFLHSLSALEETRWLGHPRPPELAPAMA